MLKRLAAINALAMLLPACAALTSSPAIKTTDSFCLIAEPITFDRLKDTEATIEQVKEHNAIGKRLCGWKGAVKPPVTLAPGGTWGGVQWLPVGNSP